MKFRTSYKPLALGIIFVLVISLVPVTPVFSGNTPVCQGSSSPPVSLRLSGRVITPSQILLVGSNGPQPCAPSDKTLNLVSLSRTIVVSPAGTPVQNGLAVLNAMTVISNANPSPTNSWLLKLEPGQYDLGNQSLKLLPYVDLEGSGEGTTLISSNVSTPADPPVNGTLVAASNSEVRFISITNTGSGQFQVGVYVPLNASNVRFVHLSASINNTVSGVRGAGVYNLGSLKLENSTLNAGNFATDNYAVFNSSGATLTFQSGTLSATGGHFTYGLYNLGNATLQNITLEVSGASEVNNGIYSTGSGKVLNSSISAKAGPKTYGLVTTGNIEIQNSNLSASGGSYEVFSLYSTGGVVTVQNSTLSAAGTPFNGAGVVYTKGGTVTVQNGTLSAPYVVVYIDSTGTVKIGSSQLTALLAGLINNPASYQLVCVTSYNGNFQPVSANCV